MELKIYNTINRRVENFVPMQPGKVGFYSCGPTVYNYAHIGNLRTFLFEDLLKRTLLYLGYDVTHVMNITDVGHLTGDGDDGEDKLQREAEKEKKSVWDIARFYTDAFFRDYDELNMIRPTVICKATEHIGDMIALIRKLEERGHTYIAGGNVYFDISSIDDYGKLAHLDLDKLKVAVRDDVFEDSHKRNPQDFVLWFTNSKFGAQEMMWDSPWGRGFPGWHIECSAMSMKYLGEQFDIHCGGIDAIPVHHTNEIAQSEAATGKKWVNYWMHGEFLLDERGKMSKSAGGFLTLQTLLDRGYDPMDYRYFCLSGHYKSQLRFSFHALDGARDARLRIVDRVSALLGSGAEKVEVDRKLKEPFIEHISSDLNAPRALADLWSVLKDKNLTASQKYSLVLDFDRVLGLRLDKVEAPGNIEDEKAENLLVERTKAKAEKNWARADEIRDELAHMGYSVKDTPDGAILVKKM